MEAVIDTAASPASSRRRRPVVTPFARALALLAAFRPGERWLGNSELAARTALPASTVTRLAQSLAALGYLRHAPHTRKFCLAPAVLALGYGAIANAGVHPGVSARMRALADGHQVHVNLCARDRLELIVVDTCLTSAMPGSLQLDIGTRLPLAASAAGWALLGSLPETERSYLLQSVEQQPPRNWSRLRRLSGEALLQVRQRGYCLSVGSSGQPLSMASAPLHLPDRAPMVLSCMGPASAIGRARIERELGPALLRLAGEIQREGAAA